MKISNEIKFGILSILAIVAFIVGVNFMRGSKLFGVSMNLIAYYDNVEGLIRGNPVLMKGVSVGRIIGIELEDNRVQVEMELDQGYDIPNDSRAEVYSADFLGAKAVRIALGTSTEMLEDGAEITGLVDAGLMGKVGEMVGGDKIEDLLNNINEVAARLASITAKVDTTLENPEYQKMVEESLENLKASMVNINRLTAELAKAGPSFTSIAKNLEANNENITGTMNNVRLLSDSLAASSGAVVQLSKDASEAMATISRVSAKLESTDGNLGLLLNDKALYEDLAGTVKSAQELIEAIKKNPQRYLDVDVYVFERKKKYVKVTPEETK